MVKSILNLQQQKIKYGLELRDKFVEICRADLISRVLNKANNNLMLLRAHRLLKENVGKKYFVYNGLKRLSIYIKRNMVGFKVGEFILSKKVSNMSTRKGRNKGKNLKGRNKSSGRFRVKKYFSRFRRKKQKQYIKSIKNKIVNLKKITRILKKIKKIKKIIKKLKKMCKIKIYINKFF